MTIAGQLTVTASDDPRFIAGQSIGIVLDNGLDLTVTSNIEVSAPNADPESAPATTTEPSTADEIGDTSGDTGAGQTTLATP